MTTSGELQGEPRENDESCKTNNNIGGTVTPCPAIERTNRTYNLFSWIILGVEKKSKLKGVPTSRTLNLYKFYKQVTEGDVQGGQPWAVQVTNRSKWDAWKTVEGTARRMHGTGVR
jgi:hypothetical protein